MTCAELYELIVIYGIAMVDGWRYRRDILQPPPLVALSMNWIAADMLYGGDTE